MFLTLFVAYHMRTLKHEIGPRRMRLGLDAGRDVSAYQAHAVLAAGRTPLKS